MSEVKKEKAEEKAVATPAPVVRKKRKERKERVNTHQPIGAILKQLREMNRYEKTKIAKLLNISKNHVGEVESGACNPSHGLLVKWLAIFGYEITIRRIPKYPQNEKSREATEEEAREFSTDDDEEENNPVDEEEEAGK